MCFLLSPKGYEYYIYDSDEEKSHRDVPQTRTPDREIQTNPRADVYPEATENILSEKDFANLNPKPRLRNEGTKILSFGSPTQIAGQFVAHLQNEESTTIAKFYILPEMENSFITLNTAIELSLFQNKSGAEFSRNKKKENTHRPITI